MLKLTIASIDQYDEVKEEFLTSKEQVLQLEHSLVALSKWESKWCKPFLSKDNKTVEETVDYIKCMTLTQNVDDNIYKNLSVENFKQVNSYIDQPMTATVFYTENKSASRETITSEIIYHWMIAMNIPFECQKWHLNRLLTLVNVCSLKNQPAKKRTRSEIMNRNAALNAARKQALNTEG